MCSKNKGGRPRKELSDEDFEKLVGMIEIQCTQEEICGIFGISEDTLSRRLKDRGELSFADLYEKHQNDGRASLRRSQWKTAKDGNATMQIWLGKQVLKQRDVVHNEVTGKAELFDVRTDIGEKVDVAGRHPEVVETLSRDYKAWAFSLGKPLVWSMEEYKRLVK